MLIGVAHELPAGVARLLGDARIVLADAGIGASVGLMPSFLYSSKKRQQPTRMPYSWKPQCTTSGISGTPVGAGSNCRAIGLPMSQTS